MDLSGRELEIPITRERILLSGHEGEIPIPITSTYLASRTAPLHLPTNGTPPPPLSRKGPVVKYKECLKNHAASIGGNATDGCGEFMPSGEEGTLEALKCSACNCHRNFHRKEIDGEAAASSCDCFHHFQGRKKGLLIAGPSAHGHMIMPLALQTSESDEMARPPMVKKRFRTKFTPEQKEKMLSFAERVGWRLQRTEETVVQQFCQEIGVKRRVLKVWMHNNKHNLAKKDDIQQIEC